MTKSNLLLIVGLVLLVISTSSQVAAGEKRIRVSLKFAGAFSTNVMHDADGDLPFLPREFSGLVHTLARGAPGRAVIRGFGGVPAGPPVADGCRLSDDTVGTLLPVEENPLVIIFVRTNSLLFGTGPGGICLDANLITGAGTFKSKFSFEMVITGGRGFFKGATGTLVVEGESEPVGFSPFWPVNLNAETGTIKGIAVVP